MKFVYVLVSKPNDWYYEQMYVSIWSLLHYNNGAEVYVVCDKDTKKTLVGARENIKDIATIIPVDVPNDVNSSRYLKTSLRDIIDGDFIFLDADTIVCDKIDSFPCKSDFGMVLCQHGTINPFSQAKRNTIYSKLNANVTGKPYYNSGVMFVRDSEYTHRIFSAWHETWLKYQNERHQDQLGLQIAIDDNVEELSGEWNCQVRNRSCAQYIENAKILHYYASMPNTILAIKMDLKSIKEHGEISEKGKSYILNARKSFLFIHNFTNKMIKVHENKATKR